MNASCNINMSNLIYNYNQFRKHIKPETMILGCVKADAYGHGAVEVASELQRSGIDYLSVANIDEAIELRQNGITIPILLFGRISEDEYEETKEGRNSIDKKLKDLINVIEKAINQIEPAIKAFQN